MNEQVAPETVTLLGKAQVRDLCESLDIRPTKTLGQNFVHDTGTVAKIVRLAPDVAGHHVLEVGPGLGSLTLALLQAGASVTAVEIDPKLAQILPTTIQHHAGPYAGHLRILNQDALTIKDQKDFEAAQAVPVTASTKATSEPNFGPITHLVANLPYNVAVPVLFTLLPQLPDLQSILVMVQAEVADRLAAKPGSKAYGVPSVKAQWYGKASRVGTVGRNVFWPSPNVDSALVLLELQPRPEGLEELKNEVFAAIDAAFSQRRKTLRSALATWAGSPQAAETYLRAANIDPTLRGEKLEIAEFIRLVEARQALDGGPAKTLTDSPNPEAV
ncbi:hypothetical protein BSR29_07985 [Boudabousia liubingyangii]|uniref:Ribosomal RNA small subunit methyltransferase A n=1 Tax=Boudabousia liubingyangii TaxID=1921764 RepID=A0A1Q5PJR3_9ACTO|nr:16S rRNA (adenine(1518)-N(6)/adenine(1519)-N(6))-dimethyltransferase RsmA [Boudabousia liubingyangii]OKL46182.1 hypothetical protein BSR29_07985 [Boudabousia liubingyangii]